jgi:hypothetical protein
VSGTWAIILIACSLCFAAKLAGYLLPHEWLERPAVARISALVTVALLAALFAVQTLAAGTRLTLDARVPAVAVAAVLLILRAPFVVVVAAAAVVAAVLRLAGAR